MDCATTVSEEMRHSKACNRISSLEMVVQRTGVETYWKQGWKRVGKDGMSVEGENEEEIEGVEEGVEERIRRRSRGQGARGQGRDHREHTGTQPHGQICFQSGINYLQSSDESS